MFENVYHSPRVKKEEDLAKVETVITSLYEYYNGRPEEMPEDYTGLLEKDSVPTVVKDYVAGMTDRYALNLYKKIFEKTK